LVWTRFFHHNFPKIHKNPCQSPNKYPFIQNMTPFELQISRVYCLAELFISQNQFIHFLLKPCFFLSHLTLLASSPCNGYNGYVFWMDITTRIYKALGPFNAHSFFRKAYGTLTWAFFQQQVVVGFCSCFRKEERTNIIWTIYIYVRIYWIWYGKYVSTIVG
jgi:hypothetical protein